MAIKSNPINTQLCVLKDYESIEKLFLDFNISKNRMKAHFNKKYLQRRLRVGDVVEFSIDFINVNIVNPIYSGQVINILSETEEFIVLDKPAGTHGHPLRYSETDSVLNYLRSKYNFESLRNIHQAEKGLLYRLDYVTSGVLIYCKSANVWSSLRNDFDKLVKKKCYYAIVHGRFDLNGEISHNLKGSERDGHRIAQSDDGIEVSAKFSCERFDNDKDLSLVKIELRTGFRHQIRAQLSILGFPILGDDLYGGEKSERVYLHAYIYSLSYKNRDHSFKSEPDGLFKDLLNLNC